MQDIQASIEFFRVLTRIKIPCLVEAPVPAALRVGVEEDQDVSLAKLLQDILAPLDARLFIARDEHFDAVCAESQEYFLDGVGRRAIFLFVADEHAQRRLG